MTEIGGVVTAGTVVTLSVGISGGCVVVVVVVGVGAIVVVARPRPSAFTQIEEVFNLGETGNIKAAGIRKTATASSMRKAIS